MKAKYILMGIGAVLGGLLVTKKGEDTIKKGFEKDEEVDASNECPEEIEVEEVKETTEEE